MLDEYKESYKLAASRIKGWESIDKSELCKLCLANESDPDLYNSYLAAVICRYWPLISKFYNQSMNLAEPSDCYDWLIHSIMYAFKHRQWENCKSAVFNDPKGPDKVINRCMKSSRLIHYQFYNRKKRRKDYQLISIDELKENLNSDFDIEDDKFNIDESDLDMTYYIYNIFKKKEYFLSFILDCICNEDVFEKSDNHTTFNLKYLVKRFKDIDTVYIKTFSERYDINEDEVFQAAILAKNIPDSKLRSKIEDILLRLKHSDLIKNILRG